MNAAAKRSMKGPFSRGKGGVPPLLSNLVVCGIFVGGREFAMRQIGEERKHVLECAGAFRLAVLFAQIDAGRQSAGRHS